MWFDRNKQQINQKKKTAKQTIEDLTKDIDRMTAEKAAIWNEIKDFRVSANRAKDEYGRMEKLTKHIEKLTKQRAKLHRNLPQDEEA